MKHFLSVIIVLCFSGMLFSQQFYFKLHGGYGLSASSKEFPEYERHNPNDIPEYNSENKYYSFGEGLNITGGAGYNLNSNIGCELEFQYLNSADLSLDNLYEDGSNFEAYVYNYSSESFYIIPSLVLMTEISSFKPYFKIGPVIGFPSITYGYTSNYKNNQGLVTISEIEYTYDGGICVGINSALGVSMKATNMINIIMEITNRTISYAPEKGKLIKAISNGNSILDVYSPYEKEIDFVDQLSFTGPADMDKPRKSLKTKYPFSSLAFSVGITINI